MSDITREWLESVGFSVDDENSRHDKYVTLVKSVADDGEDDGYEIIVTIDDNATNIMLSLSVWINDGDLECFYIPVKRVNTQLEMVQFYKMLTGEELGNE